LAFFTSAHWFRIECDTHSDSFKMETIGRSVNFKSSLTFLSAQAAKWTNAKNEFRANRQTKRRQARNVYSDRPSNASCKNWLPNTGCPSSLAELGAGGS
jgi:hypothetical protein